MTYVVLRTEGEIPGHPECIEDSHDGGASVRHVRIAGGAAQTCHIPQPERAGREGDSQPMPISAPQSAAIDPTFVSVLGAFTNLRGVPDEVATQVGRDVAKRTQLGIERYGTPLMTWNGRDAATDAYEEAMDLAKYCTQLYMEHPSSRPRRLLMLSAMELLLTLAEIRYGR